jgi:uncharacterized membrane protein YfcA
MFGTGVPPLGLVMLVLLGFTIATTVNTFAMEAAVLFVPAFLFVFPVLVPGFPADLGANAAIGLALFVELFGYSSSVGAYWFRHQIDFDVAKKVLAITVPLAVVGRFGAYVAPRTVLMIAFGGLLVVLSVVLYESHEHGPSVVDTVMEKPVLGLTDALPEEYEPRTRVLADGGSENGGSGHFALEPIDAAISAVGGLLAGLVGIAVGELNQTMLAVRKKAPLGISTGTSALVLHFTIVTALVTNVALLTLAPGIAGDGFTIPFGKGLFVAFGCLFGGQMGAYLNSRLSEDLVMKMLMSTYFVVGVFVVGNTVLNGTAH